MAILANPLGALAVLDAAAKGGLRSPVSDDSGHALGLGSLCALIPGCSLRWNICPYKNLSVCAYEHQTSRYYYNMSDCPCTCDDEGNKTVDMSRLADCGKIVVEDLVTGDKYEFET